MLPFQGRNARWHTRNYGKRTELYGTADRELDFGYHFQSLLFYSLLLTIHTYIMPFFFFNLGWNWSGGKCVNKQRQTKFSTSETEIGLGLKL